MKYYFIRVHYIPTEKNSREDAFEHDYYIGKQYSEVNTKSFRFGDPSYKDNQLDDCDYNLNNYAFKSLSGVKTALRGEQQLDEWETSRGCWIRKSEIVTVER